MAPAPIVFVHGAFCGGWVWDAFAQPFAAAGHAVSAPDLPGHSTDATRAFVGGLSMSDYAKAIAAHAADLPAPPVLIAHSLGGLVALLAAMRTPTAGVALLAPSAPWGVSGSTMEEAVSAVSLYAFGPYWTQAIEPDYATFARFSVDRLTEPERRSMYARMRPESGRALFETLNWWLDPFTTTMVDAARIAAPILAIAGERDTVHAPPTVRETARRLGAGFETMPGMSHWLPGEPGWEAVAARCLSWVREAAAPVAAA
jgi:pimeloyl-ACP methyl ester carboxylesterase